MENNIQNTEFEQMRSQIKLLQQKLDRQEIVNDRLLRNSMKNRMKWIKYYVIFEVVFLVPFSLIILFFVKQSLEPYFTISWAWLLVMALITIVSGILDYRVNVAALKDSDFNRDSLNETAVKLVKMKKIRSLQNKWGIVLLIVVSGWFLIEAWMTVAPGQEAHTILMGVSLGLIVGLIIGTAIAIDIVKRMQRTNDELIDQIHDMAKEQE